MMGPSHRLFAVTSATAYATWQHQDLTTLILGAVVASATSAGWMSPDMDLSRPFVLVGKALGPLGPLLSHRRGLTHWWALPVLAYWALPLLPEGTRWAALMLLIGWASHIVGDAIFGRVPLTPGWGPMVGLGLRTDGFIEAGWAGWPSPLRSVLTLASLSMALWPLTF